MTFNDLLSQYQSQHGNDHDVIFFDIVFFLSKNVKSKGDFIEYRNTALDFKLKKYEKLMDLYWNKEKPLGHITGHTKFLGLDFQVSKGVLVPRDVTEQMVFDFIEEHKAGLDHKVLDLCCGCGCIGISIKKNLPRYEITCVDKYWNPIIDTHANAVKHKTEMLIDVKDAIDYLNSRSKIDILISNPPYINAQNFKNTKMYRWESKKALIAKENGMYFYSRYFQYLSTHNFNECWLEIGYDLVDALKNELAKYPNLKADFRIDKQYIVVYPNKI